MHPLTGLTKFKRFFIFANLGILLALAMAISGLFLTTYRKALREHTGELRAEITRSKQEFIKDAVNRTIQDIENERTLCFAGKAQPCDEKELKKRLRERIRAIRLKDDGYIWINAVLDYGGGDNYAYRFVHPNLPDTEGTMLSTAMRDIKGNTPYLTELEGVRRDGEIYFDYWFKKMDSDRIQHKLTFARLFKPYDWIVATGVYLDDIDEIVQVETSRWEAKMRHNIQESIGLTVVASLLAWLLSLMVGRRVDAMYRHFLNEISIYKDKLLSHKETLEAQIGERTAELETSAKEWQSTFDAMEDVIWIMDQHRHILRANKATERILGVRLDMAIGRKCCEVTHNLNFPIAGCPFQTMLDTGHRASMQYLIGERWYNISVDPVKSDAGEITGAVQIIADIDDMKRSEEALNIRTQEYLTLVENIPNLIVRYDSDLRRIYVNPAWEKASGLSAIVVINEPGADILRDSNLTANLEYTAKLRKVLETGTIQTTEFTWVNARGETLYLDYVLVPEYNQYGEITSVLAAGHDITERKISEELLLKREQEFRSLAENMPDNIIRYDCDLRALYINPNLERTLGLPAADIIGKVPMELHPDGQFAEYIAMLKKVMVNGVDSEMEMDFLDGSGNFLCHQVRFISERDHDGTIIGTLAIGRDITERNKMEQQNRLLNYALDHVREAAYLIDEQARFLYVNQESCLAMGSGRDELLAFTVLDIDPDFSVELWRSHWDELKSRGSLTFETRHKTRDGRVFPVEINVNYLEYDGQAYNLALVRDITERKRTEDALHLQKVELEAEVAERQVAQEALQKQTLLLENEMDERRHAQDELETLNESLEERVKERTDELEQANVRLRELDRMKSMFIASMSHELRTPLNSVIGFSRILFEEWLGPLNAEQKENLDTVIRSGKHLLSLINDVIDVSRIEAGMIEVVPEVFDICDVVSEAAKSFEKDAGDKGVKLTVQAMHHSMHTDRKRLLQCLLNLVSNAVKYTEKGTVTVCATLANDGGMLEISVADTGIGIREEDLGKLFFPFVRLDSPLRTTVLGTGLGLYLTRKLATEVLRGDITVTSAVGEGSRFVVTVPVNL